MAGGQVNLNTDKAVAELKKLIAELDNLKLAIDKVKGTKLGSFENLVEQAGKSKKNIRALQTAFYSLKASMDANSKSTETNTTALKKNTAQVKKAKNELKNYNKEVDNTEKKNTRARKSFRSLGGSIRLLGIGFAVSQLRRWGLQLIRQIRQMDSFRFAIEAVTKTNFEYEQSTKLLIQLTNEYGVSMKVLAERYTKFFAAARQSGLTIRNTEKIFKSMTKVSAVLGLRTDELRGVYLALEQMMSKGKITTEELRRQLGERLPGAMGIMAASMGKTIPELDKMMKKGEVLSAEVLPDFADAMEIAFGVQNINRVENLNASFQRLLSTWEKFLFNFVEGQGVIVKSISVLVESFTRLGDLLGWLSSNEGQKLRIEQSKVAAQAEFEFRKKAMEQLNIQQGDFITRNRDIENNIKRAQNQNDQRWLNQLIQEKKKLNAEVDAQAAQNAKAMILFQEIATEKARKAYKDVLAEQKKIEDNARAAGGVFGGAMGSAAAFVGVSVSEQREAYALEKERLAVMRKYLELDGGMTLGGDEDESYKRRIKFAQEFLDTNKEIILAKQTEIAVNEQMLSQEGIGIEKIIQLQERNAQLRDEIIEAQMEDEKTAAQRAYDREILQWKSALTGLEKGTEKYIKQAEEVRKGEEAAWEELNEKIRIAESKATKTRTENFANRLNEFNQLLKTIEGYDLQELKGEEGQALFGAIGILANTATGTEAQKNALEEIERIRVDYHNKAIKRMQETFYKMKANAEAAKDFDMAKFYQDKINELDGQLQTFNDRWTEAFTGEGAFENWAAQMQDWVGQITGMIDQIFDYRIQKIEDEIRAEEEKYDRLLELAEGDEEEKKTLERNRELRIKELEKRKRKEEIKQAKIRKAQAIVDATIAAALAFNVALTAGPIIGQVIAGITAGLAAAQLAVIAAQPIPQYAKGGVSPKNELAMINDAGQQEFVERNGKILTTTKANAIVPLRKGDIIHRDYETMLNNSILFNALNGGKIVEQKEFEQLSEVIESSITNGFSKSKINNRIQVKQVVSNDAYRDKMSRW